MSGVLEIRTLGELSITFDDVSYETLLSRKAQALLAYLAYTERSCPRASLAELLWPGRSQAQSLTNLRALLFEVRQHVGSWLCITRKTVEIDPEAPRWFDITEMENLLAEARSLVDGYLSPRALELLESAIALYQGDFLEGVDLNSPDFDNWVIVERERLRFTIVDALDQLVEEYTRMGDTPSGLNSIARLNQIDPLREKTYRQAMKLLEQAGQRVAALKQYETCCRLLHDELGVDPDPETVELYERIRDGQPTSRPLQNNHAQLPFRHNLPTHATTFIGRQIEIHELLDQLEDPACRLVTIGGPGGIGKTRLAVEVARCAATRFDDGVFFVSLAPVSSGEDIVPAIINALSLAVPESQHDPRVYLIHELATKNALLVLDNLEHLAGDLEFLPAVLEQSSDVKLLATSRQRLGIGWEWYYALQGMPVPVSVYTDNPESYGGIRLFVERARRLKRQFSLANDPAGVIRICQHVEGMPLGIELAAAWLRMMSCQDVADQLIDLRTPYQGSEARHQSLQALFENTWQHLSAREQHLLGQLSVFRGGFTAAAFSAVTGSSLPELATLVDKSLVSVNYQSNRYDIHQLLRQFIRAKLHEQPADEQQALDRHGDYFVDFMLTREADLRGGKPQRTLDEIQAEIDNVRAAWQIMAECRRFDKLVHCSASLNAFYALKSMHREALNVFQQVLDLLLAEPETPERDRFEIALQFCLITPLTAVYSWTNQNLWPVAERIRELAERLDDEQQLLTSLIVLINLYGNEEWEKAVEIAQGAVILGRRLGQQAEMLTHIVAEFTQEFTGRLSRALEHARAAQALFDPDDCLWATISLGIDPLATSLSHSGWALSLMGYPDQGLADLEAAIARSETLSQPLTQGFAWCFLAQSTFGTGETSKSLNAGQAALDLGTEHGLDHIHMQGSCSKAIALVQQGEYEAGIAEFLPAIERMQTVSLTHNLPAFQAYLGYAYAKLGHLEQGSMEVEQALALIERIGERVHEALVYRCKGEILLISGDDVGAESAFEQAMQIAQRQESRFYELRATLSWCHLMQQQGKVGVARTRLEAFYDWFTEGLDRPVLVEARAMLETLP